MNDTATVYAVTDPASGETLATFPTITDAELQQAIADADRTHASWSRSTSVADRAALLHRVAELYRERREDLATTIVRSGRSRACISRFVCRRWNGPCSVFAIATPWAAWGAGVETCGISVRIGRS